MILTINDMGVNRLTVHGTKPGLSDLMTAVTTITNRFPTSSSGHC